MLQSSNTDFCIRILCKIGALSESYTQLMKDYLLKGMKILVKISQLQTSIQLHFSLLKLLLLSTAPASPFTDNLTEGSRKS